MISRPTVFFFFCQMRWKKIKTLLSGTENRDTIRNTRLLWHKIYSLVWTLLLCTLCLMKYFPRRPSIFYNTYNNGDEVHFAIKCCQTVAYGVGVSRRADRENNLKIFVCTLSRCQGLKLVIPVIGECKQCVRRNSDLQPLVIVCRDGKKTGRRIANRRLRRGKTVVSRIHT